jgi:ligand-binding sensor domain-containing protein
MKRSSIIFLLTIIIAAAATNAQQLSDPVWSLSRPSNTGIPGEEIRFLKYDSSGDLWVGARWPFWREGGLGVYDQKTQIWTTYSNVDDPIPGPFVNDIEFSKEGPIWIATDEGLVKKEENRWTLYNASNSPLEFNTVHNIEIDSEGDIWINNDIVLFEFDGANWRSFSVPDDIPWQDPWRGLAALYVDSKNHVWVSNQVLGGVAEFDGVDWTIHGEEVATFKSITEDLDGNLWLVSAFLGYTFHKYDGVNWTTYSSSNTPFSQTTVMTVGVDQTGEVYVGNWIGQVIKTTDAGNTWIDFSLVTSWVTGFAPDPASNDIWVGSAGAIHHVDPGGVRYEVFNTYNTGMPWFFMNQFYSDRDGNLWMSAGETGASRFDGDRWRNWGQHNGGLEPWPFLAEEASGLYMDDRGDMWIGSNGVGRWDPDTEILEIWDWRNTPIFGVTTFEWFAQDMNGALLAVTAYGTPYWFDYDSETWTRDPIQFYAVVGGLPGVKSDSKGRIWVADWFNLYRWSGSTWITVGDKWNLYNLMGSYTAVAIGPDDTIWLGLERGMAHFDGVNLTTYDITNSPLPAGYIQDIAFRDDGLMAICASEFGAQTPFPNGVAIINGDINNPDNWSIYNYEKGYLPHYQLGRIGFDPWGRLWISAISEAAAVHAPLPVDRRKPQVRN